MSFRESFRKAFKVNEESERAFSDEELRLLKSLAVATEKRGLVTPAILFLESFKPMNFIGSQVMVFFKPILSMIADTSTYEKYTEILSRRSSIDKFIDILENTTNDIKRTEKAEPQSNKKDS